MRAYRAEKKHRRGFPTVPSDSAQRAPAYFAATTDFICSSFRAVSQTLNFAELYGVSKSAKFQA